MANLFGKDCSPNIYGDQNNVCDPNAKDFYLRKNYIFVGDENSLASQVRLDDTKFEIVDIACNRTQLTLRKQYHKDLLGLDADDHLQYVHISLRREISADHLFTGDPEFNAYPLFSGDPTFSRNPLFSGNPLFTGNPEFQGNTLFTGPATFKDVVKDKNDSPGTPGQVFLSTADGVKWKTLGSENVYWVSKSGLDTNDGLGETTAKATIKAALATAKSGYLGKLQDAADLILANKKLIQEESFGYLMTETDLDSFSFPQEADLDVKAQAARKVIYSELGTIVPNVISVISLNPNYDNLSARYERDLTYISRNIAEDILFGGYQGTRTATLEYFDIDGNFILSIFTPDEKDLMLQALGLLRSEINGALESAQAGYFDPIKTQVTNLIGDIIYALDNESLDHYPSKEKENKFKTKVYFKRFDIADTIWSTYGSAFPTLALQSKAYKEEMRNILIAVAEDVCSYGNGNIHDTAMYYVNEGIYADPTAQAAAVLMFGALQDKLSQLISDLEIETGYVLDYILSKSTDLINYVLDAVNEDTTAGLPLRDNGNRNKSASACKRDIGYFIDAIASDLKNGGTVHTIEFGEAYSAYRH
jgi:hypothetical protein